MLWTHPVVVSGLVARYGEHEVLSGVEMAVDKGEVHVILGGSGSGKSTLLKHVIGLYRPHAGSVQLLGLDVNTADEPQREAVLGRIGMLFQNGALLNALTLWDNLALPLRQGPPLSESAIDEIVRSKLELVGLGDAVHRMPKQLSGGMVKRAALARAVVRDPEVLFCDEPSAGLDPVTAAGLDQLLLDLRDRFGMAIVVVTHELESIKTIADRVTMLGHGKVIAQGRLADVQASANKTVRAFFDRLAPPPADRAETVWELLQGGRHVEELTK